jgi:hypothetical protein
MTDNVTPTLGDFLRDYERCGAYLRRKDATPSNPSELYTADDILAFACNWGAELGRIITELQNKIARDKISVDNAQVLNEHMLQLTVKWNRRLDELKDCGESQTEDCCGECLACKNVSFADAIKQLSEAKTAMKDIATHLRVISSEWGSLYWWQNNPSGIAAMQFITKYYQCKR